MGSPLPDISEYAAAARAWLEANAARRPTTSNLEWTWGKGSDDVAVFRDMTHDEEGELLRRTMAWQRRKFDAGYGAITWPDEYGGAGLPAQYERAFADEEAAFDTPPGHETVTVTNRLIAPTIRRFGTAEQKARFIRGFLRTDQLCCQLFSEPEAGSDLAALNTRAVRDGEEWVVTGQKVWSSGARFSEWGELICRTDPSVPKHDGLTVFLVPMNARGIDVRPIRQITGGASFNEVFLDEVRVPDALRLGQVGSGWKVTLTTLMLERAASGSHRTGERVGGSWPQVAALARWLGLTGDPVVRQRLARLYSLHRIRAIYGQRLDGGEDASQAQGASGSVSKLLWTRWMSDVSSVVSSLLGPRLVADTGEWGTYAWSKHILGAPGYRIAGGSDEIQRNIIGERFLGLPPEPRVDRDVPFNRLGRDR
jgi:alkylation response protein AidB-like acyl-CoA dehydrogenase